MEYKVFSTQENVVCELNGCVDTFAANELGEKVDQLIAMLDGKPLLIDCTNLEYISSSGLRLLMRIRKSMASPIALKNVNSNVRQVLSITKLNRYFELV